MFIEFENCSAAPGLSIFNWTTLIDFHLACCFGCTWWWTNAIFNFSRHGHESLFHIGSIFSRGFKEWNSQTIGKFLQKFSRIFKIKWKIQQGYDFETYRSCSMIDNFLCGQITLIANQKLVHIFASITFNFFEPLFHVVERFLICAIVHYDNAMSTTIIRRCNLRSETRESFLFYCRIQNWVNYSLNLPYGIALVQLCPRFAILSLCHPIRWF